MLKKTVQGRPTRIMIHTPGMTTPKTHLPRTLQQVLRQKRLPHPLTSIKKQNLMKTAGR